MYFANLSQLFYMMFTITHVYAFICNPIFAVHKMNKIVSKSAKIGMSNDYLENINKSTTANENRNLKKLEGIRKNITNYIKAHKDDNTKQLEHGYRSTYQPIPKAIFDTIFMNINQIKRIYMSYNLDRMIFEMQDKRRFVYYINNTEDYKKMEQLMLLIPSKYKTIIINDVHNMMDDPFGFLYCDKK